MKCIHCSREFSNPGGRATHVPYCKSNPERIQKVNSPNAHRRKGGAAWNKGLTKDTDSRIKGYPARLGIQICFGHNDATKKKLSKVAYERGLGGYIPGSGLGKKGWYKGFFCDSSWELAYIVYCLDHNIPIQRNTQKLSYTWNNKTRNYIPDFIVNGVLTEIKGYKTDQWLAKLAAYPYVVVLYEKDLQPILNYVRLQYSKDYINMYE